MRRMRGGYWERPFVIKFRADARLAGDIRQLADEKQSTIARVVRDLVVHALARRTQTTAPDPELTKPHASPDSGPASPNPQRKQA